MKVFKKFLSVILTMAIMLSMICVGTVSASAESVPYTVYYKENGSKFSVYVDGVKVKELFQKTEKYSYISAYISLENYSISPFIMFTEEVDCHDQNGKEVDLGTVSDVYFYSNDGDSVLTEGYTFTFDINNSTRPVVEEFKTGNKITVGPFHVNVNSYVTGQEGGYYHIYYKSVPVKALSSSAKIKEHEYNSVDPTDPKLPDESSTIAKENKKAAEIYSIITASTPENSGYNWLGQELYYSSGTGKVYKITDNDVANWKKTGKLNKTQIKLPSEMSGGMWNLYSNQNFKYSNIGLFYKDGKQILGKYNSAKNTITKIYSTENYCGISENGVIGEFEYSDKNQTLTLNLISSAGKKIKTLTFKSPYGCSWQSFTHGSKYCYVINRESDAGKNEIGGQVANTKLIRIDEKGNQKVILNEKTDGHSIYSVNKSCICIQVTLLPTITDYYYFADTNKLEEVSTKRYNVKSTRLYENNAIVTDYTEKYSLIDIKNQKALSDEYAYMATDDGNLFLVSDDKNNYGFINAKGKELTMSLDSATNFRNGYALVTQNGKSYFIDENMNRVSEKFDGSAISDLGDGVYQYKKNDKYYLVTLKDGGKKASKSISSLSITKPSDMTYTGKDRKPDITIKDGDKTLVKGTDYTVSYKNCKKIGTASVTIKGKGNYTGTKTIEYKIVPKKTALKVTKSGDKKATFKWNKVSGAEKYEIYYSTDGGKNYKKLTTVAGSKTSYTSSKLDFKKYDYKFKIRSYGTSGETKYYSSYSSVKTVK